MGTGTSSAYSNDYASTRSGATLRRQRLDSVDRSSSQSPETATTNVLVTGSAGLIGSEAVVYFDRQGTSESSAATKTNRASVIETISSLEKFTGPRLTHAYDKRNRTTSPTVSIPTVSRATIPTRR